MPQTKFNSTNVYRWFKQQGDKERSPKDRPYLTEDQKSCDSKFMENVMPEVGKPTIGLMKIHPSFYIFTMQEVMA